MLSGSNFGLSIRHQFKVRWQLPLTHSSLSVGRDFSLQTSVSNFLLLFAYTYVDVFALVTSNEIRKLRSEQPENLATLCYKATERLVKAVDSSCRTAAEQQAVLNCVRLLTRIIPYIFEDSEWKDFFWSSLPGNEKDDSTPLAQSLINAVCVS